MKRIRNIIAKVFGIYSMNNINQDFEEMAKTINQKGARETMELCKMWFILGHINTVNKESSFNKHYNGDQPTGGPH